MATLSSRFHLLTCLVKIQELHLGVYKVVGGPAPYSLCAEVSDHEGKGGKEPFPRKENAHS